MVLFPLLLGCAPRPLSDVPVLDRTGWLGEDERQALREDLRTFDRAVGGVDLGLRWIEIVFDDEPEHGGQYRVGSHSIELVAVDERDVYRPSTLFHELCHALDWEHGFWSREAADLLAASSYPGASADSDDEVAREQFAEACADAFEDRRLEALHETLCDDDRDAGIRAFLSTEVFEQPPHPPPRVRVDPLERSLDRVALLAPWERLQGYGSDGTHLVMVVADLQRPGPWRYRLVFFDPVHRRRVASHWLPGPGFYGWRVWSGDGAVVLLYYQGHDGVRATRFDLAGVVEQLPDPPEEFIEHVAFVDGDIAWVRSPTGLLDDPGIVTLDLRTGEQDRPLHWFAGQGFVTALLPAADGVRLQVRVHDEDDGALYDPTTGYWSGFEGHLRPVGVAADGRLISRWLHGSTGAPTDTLRATPDLGEVVAHVDHCELPYAFAFETYAAQGRLWLQGAESSHDRTRYLWSEPL